MGGYLGQNGGNENRNIQVVFRCGIQNLLMEVEKERKLSEMTARYLTGRRG